MQLTPGLGVWPVKNNSLHVKNIAGGFAGVAGSCGGVLGGDRSVDLTNRVVSKDGEDIPLRVVISGSVVVEDSIYKNKEWHLVWSKRQ